MTHHELADTVHRAYGGIPEEDLRDLIDAVRGLIAAARSLGLSVESYLTVSWLTGRRSAASTGSSPVALSLRMA